MQPPGDQPDLQPGPPFSASVFPHVKWADGPFPSLLKFLLGPESQAVSQDPPLDQPATHLPCLSTTHTPPPHLCSGSSFHPEHLPHSPPGASTLPHPSRTSLHGSPEGASFSAPPQPTLSLSRTPQPLHQTPRLSHPAPPPDCERPGAGMQVHRAGTEGAPKLGWCVENIQRPSWSTHLLAFSGVFHLIEPGAPLHPGAQRGLGSTAPILPIGPSLNKAP